LGTLQIVDNGISFHCFGIEYCLFWKDVAAHLGFNARCSINLDFSLCGYNRHSFWHLISRQNLVGKFQPNANNIHHPTLRLLHKWLACSFFSRDNTHLVLDLELKMLAMLKKIKVAPVYEIVKQWLHSF